MHISVVTLFPELVNSLSCCGIPKRAIDKSALQLCCWDPRQYTHDRYKKIDDRPYGGGPGMVMMAQPLRLAIQAAKHNIRASNKSVTRIISLSPQGRTLTQEALSGFAAEEALILICGRYEGIDERTLIDENYEEWSVGDYVLSGGELAAMVLIDGISRLLPGVLGHDQSAQQDSFANGILDCPHYTRPETIDGITVPSVLLSGDHQAISRWRQKQALGKTWQKRPDLLKSLKLNDIQQNLLQEFIQEHEQSDK